MGGSPSQGSSHANSQPQTHAPHHKYDIQLSYFLEANQQYAVNRSTSQERPRASCRPRGQLLTKFYQVSASDLKDEFVWSIACRWQGLRLLQDLYRHPSMRTAYSQSSLRYRDDYLSPEGREVLRKEGSLPTLEAPDNTPGLSLSPFDARQTQRFYQSLSAQWLAIEVLCLWRVSVFETSREQCQTFERILEIWSNNPQRGLSEAIDVLEIFDFVWGFLLRRIFANVADVSSWLPLDPDDDVYILIPEVGESSEWDLFIRCLLPYIRPPDIIELVMLRTLKPSPSWSPDKRGFLRQLGFFDTFDGICLVDDVSFPYDTYFPPSFVEADVLERLKQCGFSSDDQISRMWKRYRDEVWVKDARGKALFWDEDHSEIFKHIITALERES